MYLYCHWRSNYQQAKGWCPIKRFNSATFICMSKVWTWNPNVKRNGHFLSISFRWEMVTVHFIDISRIVDYHCLNFLFILYMPWRARMVVGLPNNSYKPITNTAYVRARLCKLQKRVHSTSSRKWKSLPVTCPWSVVLSGYSGFFHH